MVLVDTNSFITSIVLEHLPKSYQVFGAAAGIFESFQRGNFVIIYDFCHFKLVP